MRDLAAAIKDRLITEPVIADDGELEAIAAIMGLDPASKMSANDGVALEQGARRYAGLLFNTPQFMLSGVPSRDQDPAAIPKFAVAGTDTEALCKHLAPLILADTYTFTCSADGIKLAKK